MKPLFSLLQHSRWFIAGGLLLSSLACPLHAGINSVISFDLQAIPPASFSEIVTAESWGVKLTGDRKQPSVSPLQLCAQSRLPQAAAILSAPVAQKPPGTMSHHDRYEESPEPVLMAGLLRVYESLQALFDWPPPAPFTLAAGMGGAGGGDDGDDYSQINKFELESQPEFFGWVPVSLLQRCLKQKQRLLKILHKRMQWAQVCGNRSLVRILRDRIMLIEIDRDFLHQQTSHSAPLFRAQMQEWLIRDSQEIQLHSQDINDGRGQTLRNSFWGKRGRQATGSGGKGTSGAGATSKPAGQTRIAAQKNGAASHQLPPVTLDNKGYEREEDNDPPPAEKAQPESAASIVCSRCQKTLNEQEVTRVLRGSTTESVACDACLSPASQTRPQETTGKRKATRKRTLPDPAAPQAKRSKSQAGKRKQASNRQGEPAAKRARLEILESTEDIVGALAILKQHLAFEMDEQEREAAKQLFERLKTKQLKVKQTFYKLLSRVDRKGLTTFCNKASVFFGALTSTIKDTGCLTSMLKNKCHLKDFARREDSELEYLAGLDTLRTFSSMNHGKGLPDQAAVEALMGWEVWKVDDRFSIELLRTFSSMNSGKGLPERAAVEALMGWDVWKVDDRFSMDLLRAFSSMNRSRGLPIQADVEAVKGWKVWKVGGQFSMDLLRAFSSMNAGKGLPEEAAVEALMGWKVWKVGGRFSMDLLRIFSSMNNGKGLPKKAAVEALMGWQVWKVGGRFSMELLRIFSSMNSSKGLPKRTAVEALMGWEVWKVDGQFNMALLRTFSSMNNGKGLPKRTAVEALMGWKVWKVDDQFNMDLLRAFSSMNNGKGLPEQTDVEALMGWEVWKVDDQFNMDLLRAFSSMNNGKGLPDQAAVKELMGWKVWKVDGQFSMDLLRAFSSMNHGKGLPEEAAVKALMGWEVWKVDGQFSMDRLHAFSSMNHGKGLPEEAAVKALMGWDVWKVDDRFSMDRLHAFSSMNSGKGLPERAAVEALMGWKVWKVDDQFSMDRLHAFSSMNSGKGLPKRTAVEALMGWEVWKVGGRFNMALLRAFSSMNSGKGFPEEAAVKALMGWEVWKVDGQFCMERLRAFSSMNHGKGLPKQAAVEAVMGWLNYRETLNDVLQSLIVRLYVSEGLPDTKKLKQYEQTLSELFFANASTERDSDDEEEQSCLIKQAALFLSTRKSQYFLSVENVEHFCQQETGAADRKLEKLLKLLTSYGGGGVTRYLALNDSDRQALLSTCTSRIPLPLAMKAIHNFSPRERKLYLFFSRNLKAPPEKEQWNDILPQLLRLASVLKTPHAQRLYLEVVWSLTPSDRAIFLDGTRAASITGVFPSLNALKNLANRHSRQWLKELLEACLQYGQGTPSGDNIKRLFAALLETQLPMFGHGDIPDHFLSGYIARGDSAIFIPVTSPIQTTEELALHFVAAVMGVLSDMFYDYEANKLKIEQYGGERHTFPAPELKIHADGLEISNWTAEVFNRFLAVTEFPEHYYFSEEAWQQHGNPGAPGYFQRRMTACHQRERAAPDAHTFQPLSVPALTGLLKHNIPINSAAWKSFDHHKDRLPRASHRRLLSEIEKTAHEDIPVSLKEYLEARIPPEEETLPQKEMDAPAPPPPAIAVELLSEEERFQSLWADLSRKELVVVADLELLAGYKEYMTMEHIVSILKRADVGMEPYRLDEFRQLLGEKRDQHFTHDPLLIDLSGEIMSYLIEVDI